MHRAETGFIRYAKYAAVLAGRLRSIRAHRTRDVCITKRLGLCEIYLFETLVCFAAMLVARNLFRCAGMRGVSEARPAACGRRIATGKYRGLAPDAPRATRDVRHLNETSVLLATTDNNDNTRRVKQHSGQAE